MTKQDGLSLRLFIYNAQGANQIEHMSVDRVTEVFGKNEAPSVGDVGVALQTDVDQHEKAVVVALVQVFSISGVAAGAVRAALRPIYRFPLPIPLSELETANDKDGQNLLSNFSASFLAPAKTDRVLQILRTKDEGVGVWLDRLTQPELEYEAGIQQARIEARDAVSLAAQLAEIKLPADVFEVDQEGLADNDLLDSILNKAYEADLEEELMPLDLQRFDGILKVDQRAASASVFVDRNEKEVLAVFSVNKKLLEVELGVDLFYWDQVSDSFTFVQYKRLEREKAVDGAAEWVYLRRGELKKQLNLMPRGKQQSPRSKDWRMVDSPFWFKFVRGDAARELDDKVLRGMYVPADWLRLALADDALQGGQRGGFRLTYDNAKYVTRTMFIELVKRGLSGTARKESMDFKKVLKAMGKNRQVIVAVKKEWSAGAKPLNAAAAPQDPDAPF
ncbi:hypothetical protein ABRP24_001250 [Curtobacterium sp. WHRI 8282]|uniref:hypothetical protein n=1 Tax=Curtobacterium sp. WHRI 8282 TaxID=3162559 RepID=UPI0032EB33D8